MPIDAGVINRLSLRSSFPETERLSVRRALLLPTVSDAVPPFATDSDAMWLLFPNARLPPPRTVIVDSYRTVPAPLCTTLAPLSTVTGSDTLVMYTYGGDANLDGKINVDDYGHIDTSIPLGLSGWFNGDFNYDGKINVDDYGIIDFNIGIQGAPLGNSAGAMSGLSAVPEPASIAGMALLGTAIAGIRRRRR